MILFKICEHDSINFCITIDITALNACFDNDDKCDVLRDSRKCKNWDTVSSCSYFFFEFLKFLELQVKINPSDHIFFLEKS